MTDNTTNTQNGKGATPRIGTHAWCQRLGGRLSTGQKARFLRQLAQAQLRDTLAGAFARLPGRRDALRKARLEDVPPMPDSAIVRESEKFAREVYSEALLLHTYRTYYLGAMLARTGGLAFDPELFSVVSLLHDIGLTECYMPLARTSCFACAGGREAEDFLLGKGWDPGRARLVYEAISLHINPAVDAAVHGPEARLVAEATAMETVGLHRRRLPAEEVGKLLARYPRGGFADEFLRALTGPHGPAALHGGPRRRPPREGEPAGRAGVRRRGGPTGLRTRREGPWGRAGSIRRAGGASW